MKIAFVVDTFDVGGIETVAKNYMNLLCERGHDVSVYVLHSRMTKTKEFLDSRVSVIPFEFKKQFCPELYSYGVMKWWWGKYVYPLIHLFLTILLKIRKLFTRKKSYDVGIAFSGHINDLTFVTEGFIKSKQKIVWCHGSLLSYLAICDGYPVLYKKIDKIVTLSDLEKFSVYAGHSFLYKKKILNLYNPVLIKNESVDFDFADALKEKYGDFTLMIARATPQKDHMTAIKAFKTLKQRGLDKKIVFLGDGELLESHKKYVSENGLSDICFFEGTKTNVQDYIYASYINLLASVFEGLPTVIIEAMAFGKPCVMTKSDGGEVSGYGQYCLLDEIGDVNGIAHHLESLYTDRSFYEKYSNLSHERFEKDFQPEKIIDRFESFLEGDEKHE